MEKEKTKFEIIREWKDKRYKEIQDELSRANNNELAKQLLAALAGEKFYDKGGKLTLIPDPIVVMASGLRDMIAQVTHDQAINRLNVELAEFKKTLEPETEPAESVDPDHPLSEAEMAAKIKDNQVGQAKKNEVKVEEKPATKAGKKAAKVDKKAAKRNKGRG